MKHYQDTETGQIYAFEDDINPFELNCRNIPKTLSDNVREKPSELHVWHQGDWICLVGAPPAYKPPISSIPAYNPAWIAFLHPYSAVHCDENSGLNITLDQVNENSYDGKKLAEVVATLALDVGRGVPALISYDGAVAIPQCDDFPSKIDGVNKLNEILCSILLGGIHVEVLHPESMAVGALQEDLTLFSFTPSFHSQLRHNWASITDRLAPLTMPRVLVVADLKAAYRQGKSVIESIPSLSPFFLLNGYTAMTYRNSSDALNNLWIVVEQLTAYIWSERYIKNKNSFPRRVARCHEHVNRHIKNIWAKHQILRLSKIITKSCHIILTQARNKRNNLAHGGTEADMQSVGELWKTLPELLEVASGIGALGMRALQGGDQNNWASPPKANFDDWTELASKL
ncbi:hypothetical protein [Pseudomonas sediminis]|uniref:Apea-like HEPN domain-containing protein n=1 Tax=Pseudomonas sediminis TaxID=1691904 RepID=A0ABX6SIF3_9PSED|nr:hypothetical protein [Pseudomonas sediminis]QNG99499.1 hypothetical protein HNQ25_14395 [Pseudomonas sediminis]